MIFFGVLSPLSLSMSRRQYRKRRGIDEEKEEEGATKEKTVR